LNQFCSHFFFENNLLVVLIIHQQWEGNPHSKNTEKFGSMNTNGIKKSLVYLALAITPFSLTRSLKISSSINWTAITGEAANTNAMRLVQLSFHY
jgi:hypothetical protein